MFETTNRKTSKSMQWLVVLKMAGDCHFKTKMLLFSISEPFVLPTPWNSHV